MDEDRDLSKHTCRFCSKSFPCGRSLGGHMRSHLISISSHSHRKKKILSSTDGKSDQLGYGLRANPRKTNRALKSGEEDALLEGNFCKECGKGFQSVKALFGHMKCHSVNGRVAEEDSWDSSDRDRQKVVVDSQSDNEGVTDQLCRRKRSERCRRYTSNNSSSLSVTNLSSEIEQQEQEEVALSLIILSRDKGDWCGLNSVVESSGNSSQFVEISKLLDKKGKRGTDSDKLKPEQVELTEVKNPGLGCNESEVDSPRNPDRKSGVEQFEMRTKVKSRKRKCIDLQGCDRMTSVPKKLTASAYGDSGEQDLDKKSKFACSICKKGFPSYQALGGHRASHKKFKGSCAPRSENSVETEHSPDLSANSKVVSENPMRVSTGWMKNKEHECPICFKVFPSGQALGGHKRSHLISDQVAKSSPSIGADQQPIQREIRHFLDLNLPAPDEEGCDEFKPWWIEHGPLLGLLSS